MAKSLLMKAFRIGWPAGMLAAAVNLPDSTVERLLQQQVFEDLWPAEEDLPQVLQEIGEGDFTALCARETHHGRGVTVGVFHGLAGADRRARKTESLLRRKTRDLGLRGFCRGALRNLMLWMERPYLHACGETRTAWDAPYRRLPPVVIDLHTGLTSKQTFLSGTPSGHRRLCRMVQTRGWEWVRRCVDYGMVDWPEEPGLF